MRTLVESLGYFLIPQLTLSVLTLGIVLGYFLAMMGGRRRKMLDRPWTRPLETLANIAVSIGLLGSVVAFVRAFSGFSGAIDTEKIVSGLGTAYTTTGVGLVTAIVASLGIFVLDIFAKRSPMPIAVTVQPPETTPEKKAPVRKAKA